MAENIKAAGEAAVAAAPEIPIILPKAGVSDLLAKKKK